MESEINQIQNQLKEKKDLALTLEAQLLTAQEELENLTIKINSLPTWERLAEIEMQKDKAKKENTELEEKLEQITHEKQELEVRFEDLSANRFTSEEVKQENQKLSKELNQSQKKIKELEKKLKKLESEILTEQIANDSILGKLRKEKRAIEQELVKKQIEATNYEKRKQVSDKIIRQLKEEVNELKGKLENKLSDFQKIDETPKKETQNENITDKSTQTELNKDLLKLN